MAYVQAAVEEAKLTAQQEAKKIIINTIQRIGTEEAIDNCVSVFNIESDDVKGRIIGREGRNIRAIEAATGVEIIVDDTPEAIILSCFDSVRREIARLSLHKLVTDGRIHPADGNDQAAAVTIEKLGLDIDKLRRYRRDAIDGLLNGIGEPSQDEKQKLIEAYETKDKKGRFTPFCTAIVYILTNYF